MRAVVALLVGTLLVGACRHGAVTTTPSRPAPTLTVWTLAATADDADRFCVAPTGPGDPAEGEIRCTSIADVRRYVRTQRLARAE